MLHFHDTHLGLVIKTGLVTGILSLTVSSLLFYLFLNTQLIIRTIIEPRQILFFLIIIIYGMRLLQITKFLVNYKLSVLTALNHKNKNANELNCYNFVSKQEGIAVGRTFAALKDYQVDGNKEMIAIGLMNMVGSSTSCYVTTGAHANMNKLGTKLQKR
jgi:MFS superfamily sulfate permease-like transporter